MPPSFAALETRLAATSVAAFNNATLSWTGHSVSGVFDAQFTDTLGMSNSAPEIACVDADVAALTVNTAVSLLRNGVTTVYTVREKRPDGNGITHLVLQSA
jgi:hypothetical protein